jgi:hypothetical protein
MFTRRTLCLFACLLGFLPLSALATVPLGYVLVSGSTLVDSTGTPVANATISFAPVSSTGAPISYRINGHGQSIQSPVTALVTSGAFSIQVADTALTSPVNVCFNVTVIDNVSGNSILGPGYGCVQPAGSGVAVTGTQAWCTASGGSTGGACNFDTFTPNLSALILSQAFPTAALGIGTVVTGTPGSSAAASISGSAPNQSLNLTLPAGTNGTNGLNGLPGPPITFRGPWSSTTSYATGDGVQYGGSSFSALISNTNVTPIAGGTWALLAQSGAALAVTTTPGQVIGNVNGALVGVSPTVGGSSVAPSTSVTFPIPTNQMIPGSYTGLAGFGDSITCGNDVDSSCSSQPLATGIYLADIATKEGLSLNSASVNNYGIGGDQVCDTSRNKIFTLPNPNGSNTNLVTYMVGLNDALNEGRGPYQAVYQLCDRANLTNLITPARQKVSAASCIQTGTWVSDGTFASAGFNALASSVTGATLVCTLNTYSSAQYGVIWYRMVDYNATVLVNGTANPNVIPGGFSYLVDTLAPAVMVQTGTSPLINTANGTTDAVGAMLTTQAFSLHGPGAHTITIANTMPTGTFMEILGVGALTAPVNVTNIAVTGGVATATAINTFVGGEPFAINGFSRIFCLNGTNSTVSVTGLSGTSFQFATGCANVASTGDVAQVIPTTPALWVGGTSRQLNDASQEDTAVYNGQRGNDLLELAQLGVPNLNWVNVRKNWTNTVAEAGHGPDPKHPNLISHQEIADAFTGLTSLPQFTPLPDPCSNGIVDSPTTFPANFTLSNTDCDVNVFSSPAVTINLPYTGMVTLPRTYHVQNNGAGTATFAVGTGATTGNSASSAVNGLVLSKGQGVIVQATQSGDWNIIGKYPASDSTQLTCTAITASATLTITEQCLLVSGSSTVLTFPTTSTVGKQYYIFNTGTTVPVTFASGVSAGVVVNPGEGLVF